MFRKPRRDQSYPWKDLNPTTSPYVLAGAFGPRWRAANRASLELRDHPDRGLCHAELQAQFVREIVR
jgi:hypothetical protein